MKIAFVDETLPYLVTDAKYPVGGWAVELLGWLDGLGKTESESFVISWSGCNQYIGEKCKDIKFEEVIDLRKGTPLVKYAIYFLQICKVMNKHADLMIQGCAGLNTGICALATKIMGKKFFYRVVNDMDVDDRCKLKLKSYEYYFFKIGLRLSDGFICQNNYQLTNLKSKFPKKHAFVVHNPYKPLGTEAANKDRNYIAWLGVFSYQKNLPKLFEIASQCPSVIFRVAGAEGTLVDEGTLAALKKLKKLKNVRFEGYLHRNTVADFLQNAFALLNTSRYEGFSNTFLECLGVGTPIITSEGVDPDHIVEKNNLGYVVSSIEDYVLAIDQICHDDEFKRQNLSLHCKKYIDQYHDPETQARVLLAGINT